MYTLHPITTELVSAFLQGIESQSDDSGVMRAQQGMAWLRAGDSRGPDVVTHSLALFLTLRVPVFTLTDISLTGWEATIDRGVGMLLRPPSRIFVTPECLDPSRRHSRSVWIRSEE